MTTTRDPAAVLLDRGARDLLTRAYAAGRGNWVGTRLADPGPETRLYLASMGIDWRGPDNPSVPGGRGGLDARDRWTRAYVRALYYNHTWYGSQRGMRPQRRNVANKVTALKIDVGRRLPPLGIFPAGRAVRIRILTGGRAAYRASLGVRPRDRIFEGGQPEGDRASDVALRDW